jgi:ribosomal protein S18 acetylase RimI-like enzyme
VKLDANLDVRRVSADEAEALWKLRHEALEREPFSFSESVDEFRGKTVEEYREQLCTREDNYVVGAFDGINLVAMAGFYRELREKRCHKGHIWGVYVSKEHRGKGVARMVLMKLLDNARALPGLERVLLTVTSPQQQARHLYLSLGFRSFGVEPKALQVNGCYVDEEYMILDL